MKIEVIPTMPVLSETNERILGKNKGSRIPNKWIIDGDVLYDHPLSFWGLCVDEQDSG